MSIETMEADLKSFIGRSDKKRAELEARMLGLEQHATRPTGSGGSGSESGPGPIAPKDAQTGLPILTKAHRLYDNLPGEKHGLDGGKYFRGLLTGNWDGAPEERKAFSELTSGAGGYTIPLEISAQMIDYARNAMALVAAGATTIPMTNATLRVPVLSQDLQAAWKQELASVSDAGGALDKVDATAHTLVGNVLISVELFEDSPQLWQFLLGAFARAMAVQLDMAGLTGTGTYAPTGLLNNSLVNKTVASNPVTWDELSMAAEQVQSRNYTPNAYILGPHALGTLVRSKASTAGSWLGPSADVAAMSRHVTSSAAGDAYVGDFSNLWLMPRTTLTMEVSREAPDAWTKLGVNLRAYLRADIVCVAPAAFQILTSFGS